MPDWEDRLHDYLAALAGATFVWGQIDCCTFAAGAVEAVTGVDPIPEFRGRYTTARGSVRALRKWGSGTLEATIAAKFEDRPLAFAHRGDLVMIDGLLGVSIGVAVGADALFVGDEDGAPGLVRFPRAAWRRCWKVG